MKELLKYIFQVSMATKMATVEKAEELLEKLRSASWNAAVQGSAVYLVSSYLRLQMSFS
jgi:hypothetical protein